MRTLICLVSALLSSTVVAQDHRLTAARLDGNVLRLQTASGLQAVRHFELPNPPRLVLDLFGIDGSLAEMPAPAAGGPAIEVRTGEHPNFLRVVVDLNQALPAYQVRQSAELIEVGLGPAALPSAATGVVIASSPIPADPSRPPGNTAPVVAVGVQASPAAAPSPTAEAVSTAVPITAPVAPGERANLDDLSTDELLALIEAELKAAGLDQEQSAEELIKQVEAELDSNSRRPARSGPPPAREAPAAAERRLRQTPERAKTPPPADGEERLPFRFVDEEPAKEPPPE